MAEAFCELWLHATRFNGASRMHTWLLGIVRHKALDILRRRRDRGFEALDDETSDTTEAGPASDPHDCLAFKQDAERLQRCFEQLSPLQREALYLAIVEGLTVSEIAALQAVPPGTVATRIHHARRKLRDCVQRQ